MDAAGQIAGRPLNIDDARSSMAPGLYRRFRRRLIGQTLLCVIPSSIVLWFGNANLAGAVFWALFCFLYFRLLFLGRPLELLCFIIALAPHITLLRGISFYYNAVVILLLIALVAYGARSRGELWDLLRSNPLVIGLLAFMVLYYVATVILIRQYDTNLRLIDFALMVVVVIVVSRVRGLLAPALLGLLFSAWGVGFAMMGNISQSSGSRLGVMVIDDYSIGNPVSLGTPLALACLALILDRGRWLHLQKKPLVRLILVIPTFALLALTTSRAAWLVTAVGFLVALFLDRRSRVRILLLIGMGILVMQIVLLSPFGTGLQAGLDRTFSDERTTANRTSGRSDQWRVSYRAVNASVGSMVHGYGPGIGPLVYARLSRDTRGVVYDVGGESQLHSLYMQIGVETGLIGISLLLLWLFRAGFRILQWCRRNESVFPLVCLLGYMIIIATVSGNDLVSGTFLGLALFATLRGHTAVKET